MIKPHKFCYSADCRLYYELWQWCVLRSPKIFGYRFIGWLLYQVWVKHIPSHGFFACKDEDGNRYWREWNQVGEPEQLFPKIDSNDPKTWACNNPNGPTTDYRTI